MTLHGDAPAILIGGSGNGKTAELVMYTARYPGNMLILDPRGEIGAVTAQEHRRAGKTVGMINPVGLHTGAPWNLPMHRVNPLDILTPDSPTLDGDTQMIMEALITLSGRDEFFDLTGRHWCAPLMKHMVVRYGGVNLIDFHRLVQMIEGNPDGFQALAREELLTSPVPETRKAVRKILEKQKSAPREFSAVMSTIDKNLNFLNHREMCETLSGTDFSLSMLSDKPSVVILIIPPEYMEMWRGFIRLVVTVAALYKQRRPQAAPVLFLLEEMATLGRFEMAERLFTFGRGSGNRVFGVVQSVGQIKRHYGPQGEQIFLSSAQTRLFKGCRDVETAEMMAAMCGSQTLEVPDRRYQAQARLMQQKAVGSIMLDGADPFQAGMELGHWRREHEYRKKIERPLLEPAEALSLPDNRMIAFISGVNCPPIAAQTTPYYRRRDLKRYFMPHPYHM